MKIWNLIFKFTNSFFYLNFMLQDVKAAIAGDASSWNILYRKHEPWLYAAALRICGNCPAAKDAVQETFVQAYLKLHQLKDPAVFPAWLKTTLFRNCYRSKQQNFLSVDNPTLFENANLYEDEINRKMEWYERQTKIYASLSCLSDALQTVLLLRYFSNWPSYEEIAAILCIPVGTVRSRLNQAKQKLAQYWAKSSGDNDSPFREAVEWNGLYNDYFGNVYTSLHYREKLIGHFDKNLQLLFTSGKSAVGFRIVQRLIEEDIVYGNRFDGLEVSSSGNISIIECRNINPVEYPDRCPDSTVFVLHRTGDLVTRMNLHNSR
jgi:RNA polymerase sigma factor (sigma-70 family)